MKTKVTLYAERCTKEFETDSHINEIHMGNNSFAFLVDGKLIRIYAGMQVVILEQIE
jgi:hypothetical protein